MALQQQHEAMDAEEPPNQEQGRRGGLLWGLGAGALADISLIELNDKTNDGQRGKGEGEAERNGQGDVVDKDKHCTSTVRKK